MSDEFTVWPADVDHQETVLSIKTQSFYDIDNTNSIGGIRKNLFEKYLRHVYLDCKTKIENRCCEAKFLMASTLEIHV